MGPKTSTVISGLAALSALIALACGGDDGGEPSSEACTPVAPGQAVVDQHSLKFVPTSLCVAAGQEVLFKNSESAIHTVNIEGDNLSGTMRKGDEFRWTAPATGAYDITCEFHPQMRAQITVVE